MGNTLPDETVEIPKIGEWELSEMQGIVTVPVSNANSQVKNPKNIYMKSMPVSRMRKRNAATSYSSTRAPIDPDRPPLLLHPPKIMKKDADPLSSLTLHPPGTVTTNLDTIIHSKFRSPRKALPPLKGRDIIEEEEVISSFLPAEMFDDSNYEEFPLEELMKDPVGVSKYTEDNGTRPGQWKPCDILNYDPNTRLFVIQWKGTNKRKKVPRFNLRFDREDPAKFERRVNAARHACAIQEAHLRFESRVGQMPIGNLPMLAPDDIANIHRQIGAVVPTKYVLILRELDEEVEHDFKLNNNRLEFIHEIQHNPLIPNRDEFLDFVKKETVVKNYGLVATLDYNFEEILEQIRDKHVMASRRILEGLQTIWGIFQDSENLSLLTSGFTEVLSIKDFCDKETDHLNTKGREFKGAIQDTLEGVITSTMSESLDAVLPKEKKRYEHMISVTQRMLHTVLLKIAENSLNSYQALFRKYMSASAETEKPQFWLKLIQNEQNCLAFAPSLDDVKVGLEDLLQKLENILRELPHMGSAAIDIDAGTITYEDCLALVSDGRQTLKETYEVLFAKANEFLESYKFLEAVMSLNTEEFSKEFDPEGKRTLGDYRNELNEFRKHMNAVHSMRPETNATIFMISAVSFKEELSNHIECLTNSFLMQVKEYAMKSIKELREEFEKISVELKKVPETPEQLAAMKRYLENVIDMTRARNAKLNSVNERFAFLEEFHFEVSNQDFDHRYQTLQIPHKIASMLTETEKMLSVERIRMIRELRANQKKLENDVLELTEQIRAFAAKFNDLDMAYDAVFQVNEIEAKLRVLLDLQNTYQSHEKLFEFEQISSKIMTSVVEEFRPLYELWNLASKWVDQSTGWLESPFAQIKADSVNQTIIQCIKLATKLKKTLGDHKELIERVLNPLYTQIDALKKRMPLLTKLRHPGIKTKHWEEISEVVGFSVMPSLDLNLQEFLDLNLERWNDKLTEIALIAAQEYNLESALDQMDADLQQKKFVTVPFRDSGYFILSEVDDIISTVDDQLVTTQTLLTSPFIAPLKKRATERLEMLQEAHSCLDDWIACQRSWLYLFPIFTGTSIQEKLFKEANEWAAVDKIWVATLTLTHEHPEFMTVMHSNRLHDNLIQCNGLLDSITKGLNKYLEAKRIGFPRFFFLSNDELISFLSHTKDFSKMQDSMQKLFEYVNSITVTEDMEITHMNDSEGEKVQLMNPVDGDTHEIEDWLNAFEEEMRLSLKEYIREALVENQKRRREQWIGMFPAQVILISNQILWTQQVSNGLKMQQVRGLKKLKPKFLEQLEHLTTVIRQPISKLMRQVISCLLINEVHNRDIIENLILGDVSDVEDFKWLQQLRYYWEEDTVYVRSINNSYEYAYEYAGNSPRLVITPLTDRCYQTLLSAFKQYLSGAPSGPAGTGKTETVRDCAKALGRNCVVYNCSEEVTPEQMSQFFAGLASSGSWSCFDEFNRINIEVLSVIAQQVRSIQEAIAANVETFVLDQRTLKINANAAICITMNPGYAGRTELPDNLKALFRPCAMMVPDFGFICEILLFSGGFKDGSILAVKMVSIFDLCRKQLSNQHHYDWGLRAMKAILSTAAKMKRNDLERDEAALLVQAIRDNTAPRLVSDDLPLFTAILNDVFPKVDTSKAVSEKILAKLRESFKEIGCQPLASHTTKCIEFYETTLVRHGIMLIGGALGGKSVAWKALERALTQRAKEEPGELPVHIETLNPKAISIAELYGSFNPITSEWADGVLSQAIRACSFSEQNELKWIIVDGPVDSLWIESMNSLLDDNKVLCLPNNERIQLGPQVKMIFEVDDLSQASPATVSRCGMIYFDPTTLPWNVFMNSWSQKYEDKFPETLSYIRRLLETMVPSLIQFIREDAKTAMPFNPNYAVANIMKILDIYMQLFREPQKHLNETGEEMILTDVIDQKPFKSAFYEQTKPIPYCNDGSDTTHKMFERITIFAMVWCFGGVLVKEGRAMFDKFMKKKMAQTESLVPYPEEGTVFDYHADVAGQAWCKWCDEDARITIDPEEPIELGFVPTQETAPVHFFTRLLLINKQHVLVHGPTSSKTILAKTLFSKDLDKTRYDCHVLPMANCSTPTSISRFIQGNMHKRQRNYCPLKGQSMIFFLDNLGAVKPEIYGAQPALELLRQFFDYGGWFNTATVTFTGIEDTSIFAAMGVPGGGIYDIPGRLMRHFFIIHLPKMQSTEYVLNTLLKAHFTKFESFCQELIGPAVAASLELFKECRKELLPIPSKLHYVFDLRDIVRVFKGMLLSAYDDVGSKEAFIKLWYHEQMRVFYDRFNTTADRKWFKEKMSVAVSRHFRVSWESIWQSHSRLMFNTFSDGTQKYKEVTVDSTEMLKMCNGFLEEHNRDSSKQLDIVLFSEAIVHLSSLSRVLAMQRGHAMLVGMKSSGRKSLARLSLHMAAIDPFEISISKTYSFDDWRTDIKNLMKQCGTQNIPTCFIITDVQIINAFQLEDLSNLLINCDIPMLYEREEKDQIRAELAASEIATLTEVDFFELFMERVRKNLHILIVASPFGNVFKDIMLYYPAIRSEATIDWYMPWSQNALESVARVFLKDVPNLEKIVSVCVRIHKSVEEFAAKFLKETKRFTSATPSRYFDLLATFQSRLSKNKADSENEISVYDNGVTQIETTRKQIEIMSEQLDHDIPVLEATRAEVENMLKQLSAKRGEVETTKAEVEKKREISEKEAQEAEVANRTAQEKFAQAQPILEEAQDAVLKLDKDSLVKIKKLHAPSAGMKEVFEAVCIMFGRSPRRVESSVPGVKEDDYWPEAVSMLNDVQFIKNVTNFKIENISKDIINKLRKYCPNDEQIRGEKRKAALQSYAAVAALYDWVCASYDYWFVYQEILPLKLAADAAEKKMAASLAQLEEARKYLEAIEAKLQELQDNFRAMQDKEQDLTNSVAKTQARLMRAQKLLTGLSGETKRWEERVKQLKASSVYILGDSLLIAGVLTYMGAFSPSFRVDILARWKIYLKSNDIIFSESFSIVQALGTDSVIREWIVQGLPNDNHSIENALIITQNEKSFPLMIDPQLSGTKWLRSVEGDKLNILRFDQADFIQRFKSYVTFGLPVLITDVGLKLDPLIDPILSKEILVVDGQKRVSIGGESIVYNDEFRLYISTKYPNPQYSPEVCSQVTLINFTTTQDGLTDLLLNNLIEVEQEDLEKKRIQIMEANAENAKKLKQVEKDILGIVSNSGIDILDNDNALNTLQEAQKMSVVIEQQIAASKVTEEQINRFKEGFQPVAARAALLYFCVADFSVIDPMYQFSLMWFVNLFRNAITTAEHPSDNAALISSLKMAIARKFYENVSFSLFSRHKLLFSSLLVIRILHSEKKISGSELSYLLSPTPSDDKKAIPYVRDDVWPYIANLKMASNVFDSLIDHMKSNEAKWKAYLTAAEPEKEPIPFDKELTSFQRFLVLRFFHLERSREGLRRFIEENLGKEFVKPPTLNLTNIFNESTPLSPLIFIIMPGIDPMDEIISVATRLNLEKYLKSYSLGRGRGNGAEEMIVDAAERGLWVLLQNCHLSLSWMPRLEFIVNNLDPQKVHERFRLLLVTMSSPEFPIGLLYQGTKLIYEIPKGMRENVMRIYNGMNTDEYGDIPQVERQLTFNLAFFHAIVLERLQFGSIGWNIPYEFNPSDFYISRKHLRVFLNEAADIPYEALRYVIGELNYGGRVTDSWDRRLLLSILDRFFDPKVQFSDPRYQSPDFNGTLEELLATVEQWPVVTEGRDVGLSVNATTITARNEALKIFASLVEVQPTLIAESETMSEEQFALNIIEQLQKKLPKPFNIYDFNRKFDLKDTLSTVVRHELDLYNKLIEVISESLSTMDKGLRGLILIDDQLELLKKRILANKIPELWLEFSFPSILSLRNYMEDLAQRVAFFQSWVSVGAPIVFKLGAFYHPEEFLTAILQSYARKHVVPFDSLRWMTTPVAETQIATEPEEGIYIAGLPIEGAKWDVKESTLVECGQHDLANQLPIIHLCPTQEKAPYDMNITYECPVYRTQNRGTGALDLPNYIMSLFLPSKDVAPSHWVQRSVAAFITVQ